MYENLRKIKTGFGSFRSER